MVSNGQLEEALRLLADDNHNDAILLLGNYNSAKSQYNRGILDYGEWSRTVSRTNYAVLEVAKGLSGPVPAHWLNSTPPPTTPPPPRNAPASAPMSPSPSGKTVFISYNHTDAAIADQVRDLLEAEGVDVILDRDDMQGGQNILSFIQESIKRADAVVSIVSKASLASGWVGEESISSLYAIWLADKKFIPLNLDNAAFGEDFELDTLEELNKKIVDLDAKIRRVEAMNGSSQNFVTKRERFIDLRNNLGKILNRLNGVLLIDISGDKLLKMKQKILDAING